MDPVRQHDRDTLQGLPGLSNATAKVSLDSQDTLQPVGRLGWLDPLCHSHDPISSLAFTGAVKYARYLLRLSPADALFQQG